ncbi:AraC family transcriptional regulator [Opitutaceae bacterium TAV4]|nr:AraC family transcriptional regulator [Opitutaceae bacterium TAV4]RRK02857.1 AraC family transcriptional regulator [Opitutaceae bacterium TAV3]
MRRYGDWGAVRYGLVWAYEGAVWPASIKGDYTSRDYSCWLVRRGRVKLTTGRRSVVARAGQWAFVAVPERHQEFSADAEILSLHFHFTWPGGEPVVEQSRNVVFDAAERPDLERAARPVVRLVGKNFPGAHAFLSAQMCTLPLYLRVQNLLPRWIEAWLEAQAWLGNEPRRLGELDERVLRVLGELDRRPLGWRFAEQELAGLAGLGRSQMNALFVRATGVSPRRYWERRRLEAAERLLKNTEMSVKEIGLDLGFRYESHFSQWFRTQRGASPSAWKGGGGTTETRRHREQTTEGLPTKYTK